MDSSLKRAEPNRARWLKQERDLIPAQVVLRSVSSLAVIIVLSFLLVGCDTSHSAAGKPAASVISIVSSSHAAIETVATANGLLYLTGSDGVLAARQASNGRFLWSQPLSSSSHRSVPFLAAAGNMLYDAFNEQSFAFIEARQGSTGALRWKRQISLLGALPLKVSGTILYVSTRNGFVSAFNTGDGGFLWHYATGRAGPLDGTLYSLGEYVAILSSNETVHILNAQNGSQVLSYQSTGGEWWPSAANGIIYVHPQNQPLQAYRLSDGSLLWSSPVSGLAFDAWTMNEGTIYLLAGEEVKALEGQNGSLLWQASLGEGIIAGPMVQDQMLYTITQSGTVLALHAVSGILAWKHQMNQLHFGSAFSALYPGLLLFRPETTAITAWDSTTGEALWHYHASTSILWEPQEDQGILFLWKSDGTMDILQASTGALLWRYLL